jgi:uncharacterized surface protein with fasciclin (FAS1) repeats
MSRFLKFLLCLVPLILVLTNCKKDKDKYYERPANLASPIYQRLTELGRFTNYLACINRTSYKDILSGTGYYTVFAPNDSAFNVFLTAKGVGSVNKLDDATVNGIVKYSIVFNSFNAASLVDWQGISGYGGLIDSASFKRKTVYDKGFYKSGFLSDSVYLDGNTNGTYVDNYNNYKYIPYFSQRYLVSLYSNMKTSDYAKLFPGVTLTDFNIVDANIVTQDINAENGFIHEVNKVITPLPNIYEYLSSNPDYSLFKSLIDAFAVYTFSSTQTTKYRGLHPGESTKNVYIKGFTNLSFAPNNENYNLSPSSTTQDAQGANFTIFAPNNTVLRNYIGNKLAYYYGGNANNLPVNILRDFVNLHLFKPASGYGCIWPSNLSAGVNSNVETPNFTVSDISVAKVLSNGTFYGVGNVQKSGLFETVYGDMYLNPNYSIMLQLVTSYGGNMKLNLISPTSTGLTVCLVSNSLMAANKYGYNATAADGKFWYTGNNAEGSKFNATIGTDTLKELAEMNIINESALTDLSGEGVVRTIGGQVVRYKNGKLRGSGNEDVDVTGIDDVKQGVNVGTVVNSSPTNGICYQLKESDGRVLRDSKFNLAYHISKYFPTSKFLLYMRATSTFYIAAVSGTFQNGTIPGTTFNDFYTVLIPTDAAIDQAVVDGILPALPPGTTFANVGTAPYTYALPGGASDISKVSKFIQYHILKGDNLAGTKTPGCITAYGAPVGGYRSYTTVFKRIVSGVTTVDVSQSTPGNLVFKDEMNQISTWIPLNSNKMSHKAIIHQINNYLHYNPSIIN